MKPLQKLKTGLIELICQLFVTFVSFLTYQSGLLNRTCMASEASKLNDQNVEARSIYGSSRRSLFRAIRPGGFGPGRLSWVARRLSGATQIYWHFSDQGPYFLTISADGSNNILKFSVDKIFIYFLPKANVGTVVETIITVSWNFNKFLLLLLVLQWCFQATIERKKRVIVTNLPFHLDLTPSQGY